MNGELILWGIVSLVEEWDMTWEENVAPSRWRFWGIEFIQRNLLVSFIEWLTLDSGGMGSVFHGWLRTIDGLVGSAIRRRRLWQIHLDWDVPCTVLYIIHLVPSFFGGIYTVMTFFSNDSGLGPVVIFVEWLILSSRGSRFHLQWLTRDCGQVWLSQPILREKKVMISNHW